LFLMTNPYHSQF